MRYELLHATTNGEADYLLVRDGKVISRWPEITGCDRNELDLWDDQSATGNDMSDYQSALDAGQYDVEILAVENHD